MADLYQRLCILLRQPESRQHRRRSLDEKLNRLILDQLFDGRQVVGIRHAQGWNEPDRLARDIERFSTGRQNVQARAGAEERFHQMRTGSYQVFAIVQHEQWFPGLESVRERVHQRATRLLGEAKRRGDLLWYKHRIGECGQLYPPDAMLEFCQESGRHLQGQARLARASCSAEGEEARGRKEAFEFGNRPFTANEAAQLGRQIVERGVEVLRHCSIFHGMPSSLSSCLCTSYNIGETTTLITNAYEPRYASGSQLLGGNRRIAPEAFA